MNAEAKEILHQAGLKKTAGRLALVELLLKNKSPLTLQELSSQLNDINLNETSIYRSLDAFIKAGIVHRIETGERVWRFALCVCSSQGHCHPHFICERCGKAECLDEINIPHLKEPRPGYIVQRQELYYKGICPRCTQPAES